MGHQSITKCEPFLHWPANLKRTGTDIKTQEVHIISSQRAKLSLTEATRTTISRRGTKQQIGRLNTTIDRSKNKGAQRCHLTIVNKTIVWGKLRARGIDAGVTSIGDG
jgi:hypothetical protein